MDILKVLGTDGEREEAGVEREFGDARLRIAGLGSRRFRQAQIAAEREFRLKAKDLDPVKAQELLTDLECDVYARTILLSWSGVEEDGAPLEPTYENRYRLLRNAPRFLQAVKNLAAELIPYRFAHDEDAGKNS